MHPELNNVHEHMRELGVAALAHANWHANYHSWENDKWYELSVLQAAHAAEILIKARIAQEHPLLIFDKIPRSTQVESGSLDFQALVQNAKTIQYSDLPERLWATTGIKIPNLELYKSFGALRNSIQHFAVPGSFGCGTIDFIYKVIDPFINECWNLFAVDYNEDHEAYTYLIENLVRNKAKFLVSPECVSSLSFVTYEWDDDIAYRKEMNKRFRAAGYEGNDL
ncbi:hypothetical protein C2869_06700 [Saccharobesus litoralis]|uniref:Uncharacterized protein n=1 Tax=Saccharobesus litoralis TaxID=2172099 RepID=A0A2S0VPK9_9ALTE|nr:hypothetical protein [Saccharobesus litoralis]AWB66146.1 hypothetical protein C2869_06700 [Saccharobesus litoralis]